MASMTNSMLFGLAFLITFPFQESTAQEKPLNNNICCNDINWIEYYFGWPAEGSVKLAFDSNGNSLVKINSLILSHSDLLISSYRGILVSNNYVDDGKISEYLLEEAPEYDYKNTHESIYTDIFCIENILTYTLEKNIIARRDVGSPYYEYININLDNSQLTNFNAFFLPAKIEDINNRLMEYFMDNKYRLVENYKHKLSERADQLLFSYQEIFEKVWYDLSLVSVTNTDIANFSHFTEQGVVFRIVVKDENFLRDEVEEYGLRREVREYETSLAVPYEILEEFLITPIRNN